MKWDFDFQILSKINNTVLSGAIVEVWAVGPSESNDDSILCLGTTDKNGKCRTGFSLEYITKLSKLRSQKIFHDVFFVVRDFSKNALLTTELKRSLKPNLYSYVLYAEYLEPECSEPRSGNSRWLVSGHIANQNLLESYVVECYQQISKSADDRMLFSSTVSDEGIFTQTIDSTFGPKTYIDQETLDVYFLIRTLQNKLVFKSQSYNLTNSRNGDRNDFLFDLSNEHSSVELSDLVPLKPILDFHRNKGRK